MKVGDKVAVIDDDLRGVVTGISKTGVTIRDEDGFKRRFLETELVVLNEELYGELEKARPVVTNNKVAKKKPKRAPGEMVLDLHFERLVEDPHNYEGWERLFLQKEKLEETMEFCRKNHIKRLKIIHGLGDGVVQDMVYQVLQSKVGLEFDDGNFFKEQSGAVLVIFK